ncbi:hypothetical protein [Halobellus clavatus]|uniref:Uncharacterized protein n=1 Tax=Halobellus clavatus TaxID=660517 RepID=A0A1H3FLT5_9EURY|nr:hypothetical protein [Halobellus clavatus]SDX91328.1 hypothetical protein SAMN04487946_1046 [Halobellus clavatus]
MAPGRSDPTLCIDDSTGHPEAWQFGRETTRLTFDNTYVDAATAASGELANSLDRESDRFEPYDGLDVSVEGRLAWADGTAPTGSFDHSLPAVRATACGRRTETTGAPTRGALTPAASMA